MAAARHEFNVRLLPHVFELLARNQGDNSLNATLSRAIEIAFGGGVAEGMSPPPLLLANNCQTFTRTEKQDSS